MEVTAHKFDQSEVKYSCDAYEIYVGDHRILTISTLCYNTATKWIDEVHKTVRHRPKHGRPLVVGVAVDRQTPNQGGDPNSYPYEILQLCIGSHCLIYRLPEPDEYSRPKALNAFFSDPRVAAVGMNMVSVAKNLEKLHEIKISNPMDLNGMAEKANVGLRRNFQGRDLARSSLDRLTEVVCGQEYYVLRPPRKVAWYNYTRSLYWRDHFLSTQKVKYATLDAYFSFLVGSMLLGKNKIKRPFPPSSSEKKKKKKNENK